MIPRVTNTPVAVMHHFRILTYERLEEPAEICLGGFDEHPSVPATANSYAVFAARVRPTLLRHLGMPVNFVKAPAEVLKFIVTEAQNCAAIDAISGDVCGPAGWFGNFPSAANSKASTTAPPANHKDRNCCFSSRFL